MDIELDNLFCLKNNALCLDSLFDGEECINENDVVGKSIIIGEDFHKLDIADGKEDGIIQKDTFEKFDFDTNKDCVVEYDEYQAGMKRVAETLQNGTECDNCTANNNLYGTSKTTTGNWLMCEIFYYFADIVFFVKACVFFYIEF